MEGAIEYLLKPLRCRRHLRRQIDSVGPLWIKASDERTHNVNSMDITSFGQQIGLIPVSFWPVSSASIAAASMSSSIFV